MTPRLLLRRALLPPPYSLHGAPRLPAIVYQLSTNRSYSSKTKATSLTQVVQAIDTFHHLENHFAVPFGFVVPKSVDWPKELHNLPLGVKVHRLMLSIAKGRVKGFQKNPQDAQQLQELQDMGFPMHQWQEYQFQEVILPALKVYSSHYGGLFVPQKFVVPERDEAQVEGWPRASQGFKLGLAVAKLRKQMQQRNKKTESLTTDLPPIPETQVEALNEIDFVWHVRDAKWYQFFLPGLRKYRELYGNADVPLAFTIPSHEEDSRWPKVLEGYMLGRHVYMVRSGKYSSQVQDSEEELQKLGFSFRVSDKIWSENIFPALEVFVSEFGHCDVWQEFVVPPEAPWPEKAWGSKLGDTVKSIRRGAYDAQVRANHKELEGLGFVWNARHRVEKTVLSVVLPALVTYQRLHGTDASVTTDFVVPERDSNWPPLSRGFKLGQWITRVRSGQVPLPSKLRKELDAIGFVWRSNDQRWNEVLLPAFRVYAELHSGTCASMSTKFYVPPEAPYPRASWGANLGGALWHIRNGDSYVNCEDKQRELRALGVLSDDDVA